MAQDVIVRGVTYTGVEKLSLPVSGGSALFRDTSDADASASDVLSGKKAYNANGEINGGMTNQGAVSGTISDKDTPFQIPQGYHNGSGSVEIAAAQKALLVPGNIRDSVTILGVTGNYTGGGGGPTSADALLIVTAPSGSTVTAAKGGTTLLPTMWTTAADANFECALFVIGSALFDAQNAWTVTASLGTNTASDTVIIDSNKEYQVALDYGYYLFQYSAADFAAIKSNFAIMDDASRSVISDGGDHIVFTASGTALRGWVWKTAIPAYDYSKIVFDGYVSVDSTTYHNMRLREHNNTTNWKTEYYATADITNITRSTVEMDISGVSQSGYFQLMVSPSAVFHVWSVKIR